MSWFESTRVSSADNTSQLPSRFHSPSSYLPGHLYTNSSFTPYTPPPILSPMRSGSGLYCSIERQTSRSSLATIQVLQNIKFLQLLSIFLQSMSEISMSAICLKCEKIFFINGFFILLNDGYLSPIQKSTQEIFEPRNSGEYLSRTSNCSLGH